MWPATCAGITQPGWSHWAKGQSLATSSGDDFHRQAAFKELLKKNHLSVVSVGADFKELEEDPSKVAERAKEYGVKYVMCAWIPHTGNDFTKADADKAIAVFNKAGHLLKENGISLCYHAHGFEFRPYGDGTLFDYLAKGMNSQWANFEMDVFWIKPA